MVMHEHDAHPVRGLPALACIGLGLTLAVAHVTLGGASLPWAPVASLLLATVLEGMAVGAVLRRWRRSRGEARQLWLLLAVVVLMQMLSNTSNLTSVLASGHAAHVLGLMAALFSGLYMAPLMYMVARTFSPGMSRLVHVLDSLMVGCAAVLLIALVYYVDTTPDAIMQRHITQLVFLADAVNYSLAILVTIRMVGATTGLRRFAYYATALFLWVHVLGVSGLNRLPLENMPLWLTALLDAAFVAVLIAALAPCPRWVRRLRPSRRTVAVVDGFAPIVLTITVLALGISVSRLSFGTGMIVSVLSVLFYGLRMAYIHSLDRDHQHREAQRNQRLQQQLGTDPLTNIANRITLNVRLPALLQAANTSHSPLSVLMIDIDFFKQYNDHFGHIAGDRCLQQVVEALNGGLLRAGDMVARYGGEEFVVVLPDTSERAARMVAERLVEAVSDKDIAHPLSPFRHVTVSVGVANCLQCHPSQSIELLDAADRAMYRAKRAGRNRILSAGTAEQGWLDADAVPDAAGASTH